MSLVRIAAAASTGYETKPAAQGRIDASAIDGGRRPGAVGRMLQPVGAVTETPLTTSRPRSGPGNRPIRTTPEHWARFIAEFAAEERFDAFNFVLESETIDQIVRFGTEVVPAAKEALAGLSADGATS